MISLLYAHPYARHARLEQMMLNAVQHWPGLELRDLYQLYPDFYIDVALEQKMLAPTARPLCCITLCSWACRRLY